MAEKTAAKKNTKKVNTSLVKFPKDFVQKRKEAAVTKAAYEYGPNGETLDFEINPYINPIELAALAEYPIVSSTVNGVYYDHYYELNFRLGVLMMCTNLEIKAMEGTLQYLLEGEDSLFWYVWLRLDDDFRDIIRDACDIRRKEKIASDEANNSPVMKLFSSFGESLKENLAQYVGNAAELLEQDMKNVITETVPSTNPGDDISETS